MKMEEFVKRICDCGIIFLLVMFIFLVLGCLIIKSGQLIDSYVDKKIRGIHTGNMFTNIVCKKKNTRISLIGRELIIEDFEEEEKTAP